VKMAQNNQAPCISNCQTSFDICARLRVNSGIARNCESERDTSLSAIAGAVAADKAMNNAMSAIGP